ncbi:MAG: hypothetical protein WBK76_02750 [Candidatus Saccharimonadales bacterium]
MAFKERLSSNSYLSDDGDVLPLADIADTFDRPPVSGASIVQGMANLELLRADDLLNQEAELDARRMRERRVADAAMASAGAYIPLEGLTQARLDILDAISAMSMYRGGEKGGYQSADFNRRYNLSAPTVESGARKNHRKLVNHVFPELLRASQLMAAGFERYDVDDMVNSTRMELMKDYGGPGNENARRRMRAKLNRD